MPAPDFTALSCPAPAAHDETVTLAHGGGGTLSQRLFEQIFRPAFANPLLDERHDGATFTIPAGRLAFSTDSYVVRPRFFPGGNIGDLAVNGTVNDLLMCGAEPRYLSCGFILEEGLPFAELRAIVESMRAAAARAGVQLVTGDTKVVDRGKADGVFINTSGVGVVRRDVGPRRIAPGDAILVSGDLGSHGMAIMSVREGLEFEAPILSDTAPLTAPVRALFDAGLDVHCLRDLTRGGLASALNELAQARGLTLSVNGGQIPVEPAVAAACEILGLDPLYVANEGRFVVFLPASQADPALEILRAHGCPRAVRCGAVSSDSVTSVYLNHPYGGRRILHMLSGEQLPRIC
jgi:hydrogenase expression/formation protein HypE